MKLPNGLKWSKAPEWANVLLDGWSDGRTEGMGEWDVSRYSWAASNKFGAKRQYTGGARIVATVEGQDLYRTVAVRPKRKLDE